MHLLSTRVDRFLIQAGLKKPKHSRRRAEMRTPGPTRRTRWRVQVQPVHRTRMSNSRSTHSEDTLITQHQVQLAPLPFRSGSFGKIFHAVWLGSRVVVKSVDFKTPSVRSAYLKEVAIWKHLHHPHIVPLFGTFISPREQTNQQGFFVCEEEDNGSLRDYLFNETQAGRTPAMWRALRDAALGLHFLHRRGIVHADLKGNNILVHKAGVAKLTDFGLSFMPDRDVSPGSPREAVGAFQWKAPELFGTNCSQPTFESDVYALGMCIVEALRGGSPWGGLPDAAIRYNLLKVKRTAAETGIQRTISRVLPRPVNIKNDRHWTFVKQLCAFEPSARIKLPDAIKILEQFAHEEAMQENLRAQSLESA